MSETERPARPTDAIGGAPPSAPAAPAADESLGASAQQAERRLPQRQSPSESATVVIRFSSDGVLLELEGDDVDLGTDLKVRHEHRLIAEFRRDAVDGWWYKTSVIRGIEQGAGRRG